MLRSVAGYRRWSRLKGDFCEAGEERSRVSGRERSVVGTVRGTHWVV